MDKRAEDAVKRLPRTRYRPTTMAFAATATINLETPDEIGVAEKFQNRGTLKRETGRIERVAAGVAKMAASRRVMMSDCLLINVLLQPYAATPVETIATAADGFKPVRTQ
jgi:hypothetical protein